MCEERLEPISANGTVKMSAIMLGNPSTLGHGLDLLTGDISVPIQPSSLEMTFSEQHMPVQEAQGWDLSSTSCTEVLNNFDDPLRKSATNNKADSGTALEQYLDSVKLFCGSDLARRVEFSEAMELEIIRFGLGLSAAERDRVLLSNGKDPVSIDPNRLLSSSYSGQVCQVASQLAVYSQVAFEDRKLSAVGMGNIEITETRNGIIQAIGDCEIHGNWKDGFSKAYSKPVRLSLCALCRRKVCAACSVNKEAADLAGGSVNLGGSLSLTSFRSSLSEDMLCKKCCSQLILDALLLDQVRTLGSQRRTNRIKIAAAKAIRAIYGDWFGSSRNYSGGPGNDGKWLDILLKGEKSLAEYPYAGLLATIETAEGSESALSLLASPYLGSPEAYWKAPQSVSSVVLTVILSTPSAVSGLVMLISSCGYSAHDTPILDVWCGNLITETERTFIGRWDIKNEAAAAPYVYGREPPEKCKGQVPRHLYFRFKKYEQCRILWLKLTLPNASKALPDMNFDLLNLASASLSPQKERAFVGQKVSPCIHSRRILVLGKHIHDVSNLSLSVQTSARLAWKNLMEQPVLSGRFKVQVEAETYRESDRIVEQIFSISAPSIAGFRLDSLYTIKNSLKHAPIQCGDSLDFIVNSIEGLLINHGSLFIHVSAVQDNKPPVQVGYYTIPISQVGTALYFDFERPIQARELTFQLVGDLAAFSDERTEQSDVPLKDPPLANGLSLASKIRAYRYALTSEMGKWALLSSV